MARKSKSLSKPSQLSDDAARRVNEALDAVSTVKKEETKSMSDTPSIIEFSEDLSNAEQPEPLPKGQYPFEIRAAERKTSGKGNEYAEINLFIDPETYPADYTEGNEDGTILVYRRLQLTDNPQGRYRIRKFLEAVGGKLGKKMDLNDLVGLNGIVEVDHEMFEGENRAVAKRILAA